MSGRQLDIACWESLSGLHMGGSHGLRSAEDELLAVATCDFSVETLSIGEGDVGSFGILVCKFERPFKQKIVICSHSVWGGKRGSEEVQK